MENSDKCYISLNLILFMTIINLLKILADEEARKLEEAKRDTDKILPKGSVEELSLCCSAPVDYSLGAGNPACSKCGKPVFYDA